MTKFISIEEKQNFKNRRLQDLVEAAKEMPEFMPSVWTAKLNALLKEASNLDVATLPRDDLKLLKPLDKNASYLTLEEIKKALDEYFEYGSSCFEFIESTQIGFTEAHLTLGCAESLGLVFENAKKHTKVFILNRDVASYRNLHTMEFILIPGHFFISADYDSIGFTTCFKSNDKLPEALNEIAAYCGLKIKVS